MASIESICTSASALSDVQIHILKNSEKLLQFASDLSHREVLVFVPGRKKGTLVLAAQRRPFVQEAQYEQPLVPDGTIFTIYDEPVVWEVLQTGKMMYGVKETAYGQMEPMHCYPFVDNGGLEIGVISFVGRVEKSRHILTETAFLSLQVPITEHSNELYRHLSLQDGIILVNGDGTILYADDMAESIMRLRGRAAGLVGENIYNSQVNLKGVKHALATRQGVVEDVRHGQKVFTRRIIPILRRGHIDRIIDVITERTELFLKEEELMIKTSVIKEIHHRVKNNLQTIASLLRMQLRRVQTEEAKTALTESLNRIVSISLVHETLSHHDEEIINVSDVAEKLLTLILQSSTSADSHIRTRFSGEELMLPSDEATSLSLVLNELITNAISHGFAGRDKGFLQLDLSCANDQAVVVVADDGCGMKKSQEHMEKRRHLGLQIVQTLVEKDLGGTITYEAAQPEGTVVTIKFPLRKRGE